MSQEFLDCHYSYKSPIQYPGGKFYGARHICEYIPHTKAVVSPFCGGASVELRLTCRSTFVYAYDSFEPLINAWQHIQADSSGIYTAVRNIFLEHYENKDYFKEMQDHFHKLTDSRERAVAFLTLNRAIHNGIVFQRKHSVVPFFMQNGEVYRKTRLPEHTRKLVSHNQLKFRNPHIEFGVADFRESLTKHSDLFAYLDPPYPSNHEFYGDSPEYHSLFPHEVLAKILFERTEPWLMSYSNVPLVRDLYSDKDCLYAFPAWNQGMRKQNKSNEVLIAPRGMGMEKYFL